MNLTLEKSLTFLLLVFISFLCVSLECVETKNLFLLPFSFCSYFVFLSVKTSVFFCPAHPQRYDYSFSVIYFPFSSLYFYSFSSLKTALFLTHSLAFCLVFFFLKYIGNYNFLFSSKSM